MSRDRTTEAVLAQIRAMGAAHYEIGIRDARQGRMLTREWDAEQLQRGIPWLRRMNGQDHDIYIRPAGSVGLVLVDDLEAAAIQRMTQEGIAPAVAVETSPENFQVWVRLSDKPIAPEEATLAAKELARRYGGDPNSADYRHYGRLAGYTNRKRTHTRPDGQQPYVLLREASGATALTALDGLLTAARERRTVAPPLPHQPGTVARQSDTLEPPGSNYTRRAERIRVRYPNPDLSILDWMVAKEIAMSDLRIGQGYLEEAIRTGSPDLAERKAGHVDDYIRRTVHKILQDPEVIAARQRRAETARNVVQL